MVRSATPSKSATTAVTGRSVRLQAAREAGWHAGNMRRRLLVTVPLLLLLPACGGDPAPAAAPSGATSGSAAAASGGEVVVVAGDSGPVRAEVADDEQERAVGLMRRDEVPRGTGMVFLFGAPSSGRFYMFDVPVPLTAVFASEGTVVGVVDMPPCAQEQPQDCPTFGPDAPYDTVLETAPETLAGKVEVGDPFEVTT